ncbi:c-type cytochrome [Tranquillimonas alkanivorans]|uniref:Cytochrome c553 n=1 Tax=Tranquillimonas alkanivorans TaxID=441119 RepID=A0A1I5RS27_9RHOB|nr:c-type cytochrome [Tranquillimonas alkanivorans]SFP61379.1 Cytochrome c553 [Tranquillimonas alkanivorans]
MRPKAIALALFTATGLAAGAFAQEDWLRQPEPRSLEARASLAQGRFLATGGEFGELRFGCVSCHGAYGQGDPSGAFPRLADQSAWYLYDALRAFATGRRPSKVMGPVAAMLTDRQMRSLAAWFASVEEAPYPPDISLGQSMVEEGRQIAQQGAPDVMACVMCHGQQLVGNEPIYPYLAGQSQPYLEHQLKLFRAGKRGGGMLSVMHDVANGMSDRQIRAVSAYASSLRPEETTPQDEEKRSRAPTPPRDIPMMTGAVLDVEVEQNDTVLPGAGGMKGAED